jgi:hypothetical protein
MPPEERSLIAPDPAAGLLSGFGGGRGIAAGLAEFAQPLLEAAGPDPKKMNNALQFGMLFWNVAVSAEIAGEETAREQLSEIENGLCNSAQDCRAIRDMARTLFERYALMRPGARVNMLHVVEGLWGRDLSEGMPKFGWGHRIMRAGKRFIARKKATDGY